MAIKLTPLVTLTLLAGSLRAQAARPQLPFPVGGPSNQTAVRSSMEILSDMQAALRDLMAAQQAYYATHNTYATYEQAVESFPTKPHQSRAQVIFGSDFSWSGEATDKRLPGKSCVVFGGTAAALPNGVPSTAGGVAAANPSDLVCDAP
jgi:hypothetical protein